MDSKLYRIILDASDIPVAVFDKKDKLIFSNFSMQKISKNISYKEIRQIPNDKKIIKNINFENKVYTLITLQNNNSQIYQDFISTVSHELRTPLTSIKGFADTMLMSSDKLSAEQRNKFLTIIRNQAERLTRLVQNLLEVSNLSRKDKFVFKEIDFKSFISPIILIFEKKYNDKKYNLEIIPNLPKILADADRLEQIMNNLIDNASKYSPTNSTVDIKAGFLNDKIIISIENKGEKIPKERLEYIFNKFSRIDNPLTRKTEGSGLGLYITKTLVENMNGTIKADNTDDGNVFILTLSPASPEYQLKNKIKGELL